jgi:peptidoglycan biosynthesis protein MviN/MurJ (putative lipid II flippase)
MLGSIALGIPYFLYTAQQFADRGASASGEPHVFYLFGIAFFALTISVAIYLYSEAEHWKP